MTFGALVALFVLVLIILAVNPQWSHTHRAARPPAPPESYEVRAAIVRMCQESEGPFGQPISAEGVEQLRHKIGGAKPGDPLIDLRLIAATIWLLEDGQITRVPAGRLIMRLTGPSAPSRAREHDLTGPSQ